MDDLIKYYQDILETSNHYGVPSDERVHQEIVETIKGLIVLDNAQRSADYQWKILKDVNWNKYFTTPQRIAKFRQNLYKAVEILVESWGYIERYSKILKRFENEVIANNY